MHIPWDIPRDAKELKAQCAAGGLTITTVNSNTFQDQPGQKHSYKFGSLSHTDARVRQQAIDHNIECVEIGRTLGSKFLSIWLADGGNHPGQQHLRGGADRVVESLQKIYAKMPKDWVMYTEHKPFEPAFYSTVVCDWGASWMIAQEVGERCRCPQWILDITCRRRTSSRWSPTCCASDVWADSTSTMPSMPMTT